MDDPGPDPNFISIIILLFLAVIGFTLSLGGAAVLNVNDKKTGEKADEGDRKAAKLVKMLDRSSRINDTVSVCTGLFEAAALTTVLICFNGALTEKLNGLPGIGENAASVLSAVILALITVVLLTSLCIIFPRRIGIQDPEKTASAMAGYIRFIVILFAPLTFIVSGLARILVRLFGGDPHVEEVAVTEDEILSMVDEGEEKGVIEESQKEMINNIFEFDDLTAGEVMTHRTSIEAVEISDCLTDVVAKAIEEGYSRLPVYEEDLDNIKGILYVKDLLKYVGSEIPQSIELGSIMREAMFIPESKKCRDLFSEMTEKHLQMVVVADEYGGVAGIVTVEDLLESIVGNIQDEFDDEDEVFEQISEDVFNIDGASEKEEVEELLDIDFPEGEFDTIAGFIMSVIGRIPDPDEHPTVEYGGFSFTVDEMDDRRIVRVRAERLPKEENTEE